MSRATLDWNDPAARADWLAKLRVDLHDANAITQDMLRPPRERDLGPALHAKNYGEAWAKVEQLMAYATGSEPEGGNGAAGDDAGDPAGVGGSPAH